MCTCIAGARTMVDFRLTTEREREREREAAVTRVDRRGAFIFVGRWCRLRAGCIGLRALAWWIRLALILCRRAFKDRGLVS